MIDNMSQISLVTDVHKLPKQFPNSIYFSYFIAADKLTSFKLEYVFSLIPFVCKPRLFNHTSAIQLCINSAFHTCPLSLKIHYGILWGVFFQSYVYHCCYYQHCFSHFHQYNLPGQQHQRKRVTVCCSIAD